MNVPERQARERDAFFQGIAHFNAHDFFEAHEAWEDAWRLARGQKHEFYQGLIQVAVALVHYQRSNPRGVFNLRMRYLHRLVRLPPVFMGVDLPDLVNAMERLLAPVILADPLPERGQIHLDESAVPRIDLRYDPFSTGEAAQA